MVLERSSTSSVRQPPKFQMKIDPAVHQAVAQFKMPPELVFGETKVPVMYSAPFANGAWGGGTLEPYRPLQIDPAAKVLHYGVEAFEGMKAYRGGHNRPHLFRPEMNWRRMNRSLARLAIPELPREIFFEGLDAVTDASASLIPTGRGQSLYLRPYVFATDASLGIAGPATSYLFLVIASPAGAYQAAPMKILIEREFARAVHGGTGSVKVGGNYAAAFLSSQRAYEKGLSTTLWLDAVTHRNIEELSGMNVVFVIDGELHTPALTDTILPGVTRDSVIQLAADLGLKVHERTVDIDEIVDGIHSGRVSEAFACGTAAAVLAIERLVESDGRVHALSKSPGPIADRLKAALLDIQEGRAPDRHNWMLEVPPIAHS